MQTTVPSTNNFLIRNATAVAITTVTVFMLAVGIVFWRQDVSRAEAQHWVLHTYEVRGHIRQFYKSISQSVNGEREYLLTGNAQYLDVYDEPLHDSTSPEVNNPSVEVRRSVKQELALLRQLTKDNPSQQSNLDEMEGAVIDLLSYMTATVQAKKNNDTEALASLGMRGDLLDHIDSLARIMEAEENHLLTLRIESDASQARQDVWITYSSLALFYVIIVVSVWLYQRSRARSLAQMLLYTQELERSEEELKMQQEELKASNEEIEASNEELEEKTRALEEQNGQIQQQSEELEESKRLIEEKADEVERASKYKSEFLANMSHELRTPLNSLLILAKLLAANEDGNLTETQVEEAQVIHNGGLELLGLINDILDLSKVEAGKLSMIMEDVPVDSIVMRMKQQFIPIAKEKDVGFTVRVARDLSHVLRTDAQRTEQILKNLLSNAFKFTEAGSVTLDIGRPDAAMNLQRATLDADSAIAFSVIDTGIGIEASKFKDIFEAFQQEDGSIDRHYGGTGLGLTIARKFAHMLGGEIHVESQKGQGSRFTLILPSQLTQAETAPDISRLEAPDTSARVMPKVMPRAQVTEFIADDRNKIDEKDKVLLIIEDDPAFAATLMKVARKRGYKCLCAGDGKTGLVLAAEVRIDAVILDLKLPDIDGMAVLDLLKHDLKTRHIPVHIISGRDEEASLQPLRKGAIGYLMKPVATEALDMVFTRIEDLLTEGGKKVLVVEDDKNTQVAVQALLKKTDIQITFSNKGGEAMQHIRTTKYDCVILDLHLPDMTGFEWLEQLETEFGDKGIPPVIIYTAQMLSEEENRQLNRYTGSIIIKGAKSPERLLDEVTLFLHSVESSLSSDQQDIIRMQHNPDKMLLGRTILLVDDDLRNTFALSKLLKKHGMNIVIADNGQMALEKLAEDKAIELVIMDIMMPIMDGYQAMQEIRSLDQLKWLPIIALTARAMPEEQEKCVAAGANDYLTKPVDIDRLLTLLRVWLFRQEKVA